MSEEKEKKKEKEALAKRVETFRERMRAEIEADSEAAKEFPVLSKSLLEGTEVTHDATVEAKDGTKHRVTFRVLSEAEILEALDKSGLKFTELWSPDKMTENEKFQLLICHKAIVQKDGLTPEELGKTLRFGTSGKLCTKILFLSGFFVGSEEAMEFFRVESP